MNKTFKNTIRLFLFIILILFSNINNGYCYMRDCSWWFGRPSGATPEIVEKEIANGLDINNAYKSRQSYPSVELNVIVSPLICAAKDNNTKIVEVLLKHGADSNSIDIDGTTALMSAVRQRNSTMMKMLIKSGADINAQDNNGDSVLEYASNGSCSGDGEKIVKYLLQNGANRGIRNNQGKTPLDNLKEAKNGYCDRIKDVLENYNPNESKANHIFIFCVIAIIFIHLAAKKYDEIQEAKKSIIFSMDKGISETQNNDVSEISIEPTLQKTRRKRNVVNSASKRKLEISEEVQEHSTKTGRKLEL